MFRSLGWVQLLPQSYGLKRIINDMCGRWPNGSTLSLLHQPTRFSQIYSLLLRDHHNIHGVYTWKRKGREGATIIPCLWASDRANKPIGQCSLPYSVNLNFNSQGQSVTPSNIMSLCATNRQHQCHVRLFHSQPLA